MSNHLNKLCTELKALYWANDGQFNPSYLIKMYHGFMIDKVDQNHSLKSLAWRIVHVVTGLFAYPVLGFLAALEIPFKLFNWRFQKQQNESLKSTLKLVFINVHHLKTEGYGLSLQSSSNRSILKTNGTIFKEYDIAFGPENVEGQFEQEKKELLDHMKKAIDQLTAAYTQVHFGYSGSWKDGIKFTFLIHDSLLPYCSNPLLPLYEEITMRKKVI